MLHLRDKIPLVDRRQTRSHRVTGLLKLGLGGGPVKFEVIAGRPLGKDVSNVEVITLEPRLFKERVK
jgi:hypothetical protein